MPRRQLVLTRAGKGGAAQPLGDRKQLIAALAEFNTAPDGGSPRTAGMETCYGPGLVIEFTAGNGDIQQAMVTLNEEEIGWVVMQNLCKKLGFMLMDLETGRTFGGGS